MSTALSVLMAGVMGLTGAVAPVSAPASGTGRYVVMLRHDRVSAQGVAAAADSLTGGRAGRVLGSATPGFTAVLTRRQALRLAADPAVALIEPDRRIRVAATQRPAPWSLDRIDARPVRLSGAYTPTNNGAGVHAYVIDTGLRTTHREFGGRASSGYDFVDRDDDAADCQGHGTHVAGTIGGTRYGVAKSVRLVGVRVLDCDGSGWVSDIVAGVNWVTENAVRPAVANMSLGGATSTAVDRAVRDSIAGGVTYVAAAGNDDDDACRSSPAGVRTAVTVAATDRSDRRADFSNHGSCVDLFAPGVAITSAGVAGDTATRTLDGTSMAAPHVAGAAALLLAANPGLSPARVQSTLLRQATAGAVHDRAGSPNRLLFVPAPPKPSIIATSTLPEATPGRPYEAQLHLTAQRKGTWKLISGSLPAGLVLSKTGLLAGTPSAAGSRRFTVQATDTSRRTATAALTLIVAAEPPPIVEARTRLVSAGVGGAAAGSSISPAVSADGRYVAFLSAGDVIDSGNAAVRLYRRDLTTGTTVGVSAIPLTEDRPAISADGRYLVATVTETSGYTGLVRFDVATGATLRVDQVPGGPEPAWFSSRPAISADGNRIAFISSTQAYGSPVGLPNVYVRDLEAGTFELASPAWDGQGGGNWDSHDPSLSADGTIVAFSSMASNLVPDDTNQTSNVFVRDLTTGVTTRYGGTDFYDGAGAPAISADGRYLGYHKGWTGLVVQDLIAGTTTNALPGIGASATSLSAGGAVLAFETTSAVPGGGAQGRSGIYTWTRSTGRIDWADPTEGGNSRNPALSAAGHLVFATTGDLTANHSDTNGGFDVYRQQPAQN